MVDSSVYRAAVFNLWGYIYILYLYFIFICYLYYYIYIPYLQSLSLLLFRPVHFLITMLVYYKLYLQLL